MHSARPMGDLVVVLDLEPLTTDLRSGEIAKIAADPGKSLLASCSRHLQ